MSFRQLIKAKDDANANAELCATALARAKEQVATCEAAHAQAQEALAAAHAAIRARLKEKGHTQLKDADGTATIYQATEPTEDDPYGWVAYHPIPGDEV